MRPVLSSVFAVLAGSLIASACYAERQPPPNFRYACEDESDCLDGQSCNDGLCETPCTAATFADDCTNGELLCLNGVCSSGCEVGEDTCPGSQQCADLGLDVSGGGSFLGGGSSDATIGVCMRPCSTDSCGDAAVCLEGFCVPTCDALTPCTAGLACVGGLCLPDAGTDSGDGTDAGDPSSDSSTDPGETSGAPTSSGSDDTGGGT